MNTNYAGFWMRFVAIIIDGIIIGIIQTFVIVPILAAVGFGFVSTTSTMDMSDPNNVAGMVGAIMALAGAYWILSMCIQVLYFSFMESSKWQATIGKMALGLTVTDMNGLRLDFGKAFVRNICKIISNFTLLIGYIMAGFTDKKQALHDIIAGTLVVKKSTVMSPQDVNFVQQDSNSGR